MTIEVLLRDMLAALTLGLLSAPHCLAMCGGIMSAFSLSPASAATSRTSVVVHYSLGRLTGYVLLGVIAGTLGMALSMTGSMAPAMLRLFAGFMLVVLGAYTLGFTSMVQRFEKLGYGLWQGATNSVGRIDLSQGRQQFLAGILWGWLPCGVVYSVLALAMGSANPLFAGLVMLSFGVGTLPAVAATGIAAGRLISWLRDHRTRLAVGLSLVGFGIWTMGFVVVSMLEQSHHMGH